MVKFNQVSIDTQLRFGGNVLRAIENVPEASLVKVRNKSFLVASQLPGSERLPLLDREYHLNTYAASHTTLTFLRKGSLKTNPFPG